MSAGFEPGGRRLLVNVVGWGLFFVYVLLSAGLEALAEPDLASPDGAAHALGALTAVAALPPAVAFVARCFDRRLYWPVCGVLAILVLSGRASSFARAGRATQRVSAKFDALQASVRASDDDDELDDGPARARLARSLAEVEAEADRAGGAPGGEMFRCSARVVAQSAEAAIALKRAAGALGNAAVLDVSNVWGPRAVRERVRLVEAYRDAARRQRALFDGAEAEARRCLDGRRVPASSQRVFLKALRGEAERRGALVELFDVNERYAGALLAQLDLLGRELGRVRVDEASERVVFDAPEAAARWHEGLARVQLLERRKNELADRVRGVGLLL